MAIIEIKIPSPGESISTVELYRWLVEDGSTVKKDTEIAELESDKATLMLVAPESGKITQKASEGDMLDVGAIACTIETSADKESQVKMTPLAKEVMKEEDLSVDDVIKGLRRLRQEDVKAAATALKTQVDKIDSGTSSFRVQPGRESKTERLSSLRRKLSERLVSVKNETAMLTTFNEVDMQPIMEIRKRHQIQFIEKHGIKLGIMSFFMKASSIALQEFPNVNSMIEGEDQITFNYSDISVAVSAPKGLMVPVVRNVESLGLAEIEKEIADLATKARDGKLSIPEIGRASCRERV